MLSLRFQQNGKAYRLHHEVYNRTGSLLPRLMSEELGFAGIPGEWVVCEGPHEGFPHLLDHCLNSLHSITPTNVYPLMQAAAFFGNRDIQRECLDYLLHNAHADNTLMTLYCHDLAWIEERYQSLFLRRLRRRVGANHVFSTLVPCAAALAKRLQQVEDQHFWRKRAEEYLEECAQISYHGHTPHRFLGIARNKFLVEQRKNGTITFQKEEEGDGIGPMALCHVEVFPTQRTHVSWGFYDECTGESSGKENDRFMLLRQEKDRCELTTYVFERDRIVTCEQDLPSMPSPRSGATLLLSQGALYVCGGIDNTWRTYADVHVFVDGSWRSASHPMNQSHIRDHGVVHGSNLYVYGARGMECLDHRTGEWSIVSIVDGVVHDVRPISEHELFVVTEDENGKISDLVLDTLHMQTSVLRTRGRMEKGGYISIL